jgi:hypothetical protein
MLVLDFEPLGEGECDYVAIKLSTIMDFLKKPIDELTADELLVYQWYVEKMLPLASKRWRRELSRPTGPGTVKNYFSFVTVDDEAWLWLIIHMYIPLWL